MIAVDTAAVRRLWRETGSPSYVAHHFGISRREVMDICVARAPSRKQQRPDAMNHKNEPEGTL